MAALAHVLRSDNDTPMPMLKERHQALTEAGRVLMQHGGSFRSFISHGGNDAEKMVQYIVDNIPSYRDEATFEVYKHMPRVRGKGCLLKNKGVTIKCITKLNKMQ